jgi:hypothetical protein
MVEMSGGEKVRLRRRVEVPEYRKYHISIGIVGFWFIYYVLTLFVWGREQMDELRLIISSFANSALRTLCFGFRELLPEEVAGLTPENIKANGLPDSNLICIAIVGIKDPCRPGVPEAVARCQAAGIKVWHALALFIYKLSYASMDLLI